MDALQVKGLTKRYPSFLLDKVGFTVGEGRFVGLVGRNGAGKSTTLKGIMGLISTEGEVEVFGLPFREKENEAKAMIGYVGGGFRFYPLKRAGAVAKAVSGFYPNWNDDTYRRLLAEFGLDDNKKIREFSEGMKVKFALTLALSHGAKLLLLDEPTSGLDPLSREELCDTLLSLVRKEGTSVLFSTHVTSDLDRIADDVVYLANGKVVAAEELSALKEKYSLALFPTKEAALAAGAEIIGLKAVKAGYEALIPRDSEPSSATLSRPTLDEIVIHLGAQEEM